MGVCTAYGVTSALKWMETGSPCMTGRGRWVQVLKADEANADRSHSFNLGTLAAVGGNGKLLLV